MFLYILCQCMNVFMKILRSHIVLQEVEHAPLSQLFALLKLLHSLSDLFIRDSPLTLLLIVEV